jgi:serine/threonine protein kinase
MGTLQTLSVLALRNVVEGACKAIGMEAVAQGGGALIGFLEQHFVDQSQHLTEALHKANEQAWKALEIALAGESWWERCSRMLASGEQKAFRTHIQAFLDATPLGGLSNHGPEFRQECLRQLRAARKAKLLTAGALEPRELARKAGQFAQFADPQAVLKAEWHAVERMADEMRAAGYSGLASYLALRPPQGHPLLATAARYFFRRAVENDARLFQGLAFAQLEGLRGAQDAGFAALADALAQHGQRLEELLENVQSVVVETHAGVLDIKSELQRQGRQIQEFGQAVLQALQHQNLDRREVRAGDSLSLRNESERQLVKQLVGRYRALPEGQRRQMPALLNAIGKLEVLTGDFEAAQSDFQSVATLVHDPPAQAEADYNTYQAALERRQWPQALAALQRAAEADPARFEPFPLAKYEPLRILGAGGFGVAFLCRHRNSGSSVVLKTLRLDNLDRDPAQVFAEAQVLEELAHPSIIRLRDCDYADPIHRTRPYLVMDYFDAQTLEDYVRKSGPLPAADLVGLALQMAEGLKAAHARAILHRDVKPANLLVHFGRSGWQVKLIDFGLAMPQDALADTRRSAGSLGRTATGSSIAGTLDYAAPEQMGRLPGVPVGPYSDVYGFAKTCCFGLFGTAQPTFQHWQKVPPALAEILGQCLAETPDQRPADFEVVIEALTHVWFPGSPPKHLLATTGKGKGSSSGRVPVLEVAEAVPVTEFETRPSRAGDSQRRRRRGSRDEPAYPSGRRWPLWPWILLLALVGLVSLCIFLPQFAWNALWRGHANPFQKEEPKPLTAEEFPQAVADLKSSDANQRRLAVQRVALTPPNDRRKEIAPLLETLLKDPDGQTHIAAARALGTWGSKDNVLALIRVVDNSDGGLREAVIATLAKLKDERGVRAILGRWSDGWDREKVTRALQEMGSMAEKPVLEYFEADKDHWTRVEACKVLKSIGTKASIPALEKAANDKDAFVAGAAKDALKVVKLTTQTP